MFNLLRSNLFLMEIVLKLPITLARGINGVVGNFAQNK